MSQTYEFFAERASEARKDAEKATLDNVRERARRSEAAWQAMADRANQLNADRAASLEAKRERLLAEAEAAAGSAQQA